MNKVIDRKYVENGLDYERYRKLVVDLLQQGKSTGVNQSADLTEYSRLNVARMKRIDKTIKILPEVRQKVEAVQQRQYWLVLTEGWCGDAAQVVPVIYALSQLNDKIELKLLLRDENLDLMDQYLANGVSRSIPKLVAVNADTMEELFNWGARPKVLQDKIDHFKQQGLQFDQLKEMIHGWYATDKTIETQKEIAALL